MAKTKQQPFEHLASLGLVTDGSSTSCNSCVHQEGLSNFLTTPVDSGRALHLYDAKLKLKGISKPLSSSFPDLLHHQFTCIAAHREITFAAVGEAVIVYLRLRPVSLLRIHQAPIAVMAVVGNILITVGKDSKLAACTIPHSQVEITSYDSSSFTEMELPPDFLVSAITHPLAYLNKILLGSQDGRVMLVNIKTRSIVHTFNRLSPTAITVLQSSPVSDVVAIGTTEGNVYLHNIRADKTIVQFKHTGLVSNEQAETSSVSSSKRSITSVSFLSTGSELLVSTDSFGDVFVWDLNEKHLITQLWRAHPNGIRSAYALPGEPLLVTFGRTDNTIKVHIFDEKKNVFRLLRSRDGHCLPPTLVEFASDDGLSVVSAGLDRRLRLASLVHEARNTSFSQASVQPQKPKNRKRRRIDNGVADGTMGVEFKLPPISNLVLTDSRTGSDANILTTHVNMPEVFAWDLKSQSLKPRVLLPQSQPRSLRLVTANHPKLKPRMKPGQEVQAPEISTCVELSACGNYAFVGSSSGRIHCFNLQSGLHQGVFADSNSTSGLSDQATGQMEWARAHIDNIRCLAVDTTGEILASVGTSEHGVKLWNIFSRKINGKMIRTSAEVLSLRWCKSSNLLAMACEDFVVLVCDSVTKKIAREFVGHKGPLVGMAFDSRGRRLVSASEDNTIRVWDLASGQQLGHVRCEETPTSIALAPSNGYLASTHANSLSVKVWADMSEHTTAFPSSLLANENDSQTMGCDHDEHTAKSEPVHVQANRGATLSLKPPSHWTVLRNMKQIKDRNKPTDAPKKPRDAPFFISRGSGTKSDGALSDRSEVKARTSVISRLPHEDYQVSTFGNAVMSENFDLAEKILNASDSSGVDFQIRSSEGPEFRQKAAQFFLRSLKSPKHCELIQAYFSVFLQEHGLDMTLDEYSSEILQQLLDAQNRHWSRIRGSLDSVSSLSSFFSGLV